LGSLVLPAHGAIYVDAQIVIYGVQRDPRYATLLAPLWLAQRLGSHSVVTSQLTVMECLVLPLRNQDAQLLADFEKTFLSPGLTIVEVDEFVLRKAAQLRAAHKSLRTPDAIHAATCVHISASLFITNDRGFRAIPGLPLASLDDILASP
jgi:predicted nucleic acid-binding protein